MIKALWFVALFLTLGMVTFCVGYGDTLGAIVSSFAGGALVGIASPRRVRP